MHLSSDPHNNKVVRYYNEIMYRYRVVRSARNVCTVCFNKCDKSSSFVCNECVEPTHTFCIGMPDIVIREFQRKTMKFCCPVCVSEKVGAGYDWLKSLNR
jgi:hypothetical protein